MDSLEKLSIEEITKEIGICLLDNDINVIFSKNAGGKEAITKLEALYQKNLSVVQEMQQSQKPIVSQRIDEKETINALNRKAAERVLEEYADVVNKEAFVLVSTYNIYKIYSTEKNIENKRLFKKLVERGLRLLGSRDITIAIPQADETQNLIVGLKIVNSIELANAVKKGRSLEALSNSSKKKLARLNEIDDRILLFNIIQVLAAEDIKNIISVNEEIGMGLLYQAVYNGTIEYQNNHEGDKVNFENLDPAVHEDLFDKIGESTEYYNAVMDAIKKNSKYVDIDKLLLIAAYRYIRKFEYNEIKIEKEQIPSVRRLLLQVFAEMKEGIRIDNIINGDNQEYDSYSWEQLGDDISRFTMDRYITKAESKELKQKILANEIKLQDVKQEEIEVLSVTGADLLTFANLSEENAIYLIDKKVIKKNEIMILLTALEKCGDMLFAYLCENELLDTDEFIELFEINIISAEMISKISNEDIVERIKDYGKRRLVEQYQQIVNAKQDNQKMSLESFNKYSVLYKVLNLAGKSEEELFNEAFNLISSFDDIDSNMLQDLYQFGLIPLEAMADWGVNLIDMLSSNSLKPTDLKRLYARDVVNIENIKNVLLNGGLLYEEKLDLIYSTFDGESEEEIAIREELIELLETGESYRENRGIKRGKKPNEHNFKSREFITNPHARWKLISLLDKDYSKKFLPIGKEIKDGHRVFLLPNLDKIIIEKMHEKKNGRMVSAYGSATYIMGIDDFFKNMELIIANEAINRTALRELFEGQKATKILHTKNWGKHIKDYFDIHTEDERYTKEEIMAIDKAIEAVVNSRKERE